MIALLNEIDVLKDVAAKLAQAGLAYMLTGSMAMNYYAQPRMTRDIDIVIELKRSDVHKIVKLFSTEYYVSPEAVEYAVDHEFIFNIIHSESIIKVDFIVRKVDDYRLVEFSRRRKLPISDFEAYVVSKEDLILSKLLWAKDSGSELQLRDIRNLLATGYDRRYLDKWADQLDVSVLLQECFT